VGVDMADHNIVRGRTGLALIVALVLMLATACKSTSDSSSTSGSSGGAAVAASTTKASTSESSGGTEKICGAPPCVRFVSRGDTKTLASTLTDHPILSTVALHVAVTVLCGGILCLLGEGVSLVYVDRAAKDAANQHACLKVSLLKDGDKWRLVSLSTSNQSPYCKD